MNYRPAKRTQQAVETTRPDKLVGLIKAFEPQIKAALPKHITPERMTRIMMTEVRKNPKLADCNVNSFFGAVLQCAQLGLEPGTGLGHAYLLPYQNRGNLEVQLIVGYQGMLDLAERSGKVTIDAHVIYERDQFDFSLGLDPHINHIPYFGPEDPGEICGSYAVARYSDGRTKFRVCSRREIEETRKASRGGNSPHSPWAKHFAEMARKTAIRRLFKLLPKSPELARVQELEDKAEIGESQDLAAIVDVEEQQPPAQIEAEEVSAPEEQPKEELTESAE